ncbi:hypothetical protein [Pseudanabaena sp. PCC 6802]|nr:hypothetical protein [Pseudanabaena sp. PCC 6802]
MKLDPTSLRSRTNCNIKQYKDEPLVLFRDREGKLACLSTQYIFNST